MQLGQTLNELVSNKFLQTKSGHNKHQHYHVEPAKKVSTHSVTASHRLADLAGLVLLITALGLLTAWAIEAVAILLFHIAV